MMLVMPFQSERTPDGAFIDLLPLGDAEEVSTARTAIIDGLGHDRIMVDAPADLSCSWWWWTFVPRLAKRLIVDCTPADGTAYQIPHGAIDPAGSNGSVDATALVRLSEYLGCRLSREFLAPALADRVCVMAVRPGSAVDPFPRIHMVIAMDGDGDAERHVMPVMAGMVRVIEGTLRYLNGEGDRLSHVITDPYADIIDQVGQAPVFLYANEETGTWPLGMESRAPLTL